MVAYDAFPVLKARSARGLSLPAYVLETLSYAITLSYSARNGFPFSTYGENFFLTLQNALITILVVYYPSTPLRRKEATILPSVLTLLATLGVSFVLYAIPKSTLSVLQVATLPLSVFSKLPQITANHRARSTGNLSAFAVGSQIAGCLARLFTTITEVGDPILFLGFAVALALNCVLGAQMWLYWNADVELKEEVAMGNLPAVGEKEKTWARSGQVDIVVPPVSPAATSQRFSSPSGRRWSRKVD